MPWQLNVLLSGAVSESVTVNPMIGGTAVCDVSGGPDYRTAYRVAPVGP